MKKKTNNIINNKQHLQSSFAVPRYINVLSGSYITPSSGNSSMDHSCT